MFLKYRENHQHFSVFAWGRRGTRTLYSIENSPDRQVSEKEGQAYSCTSTRTLSLSHSPKLTGIPEHVIKSDFRTCGELVVTDFRVHNGSTALVEAADNSPLIIQAQS